jgi:tetratricopeptide (TPR) repeat protein
MKRLGNRCSRSRALRVAAHGARASCLTLALLASACLSEIDDGIETSNDLIYQQQYASADSLLRRLYDKLEGRSDPKSAQQRLAVLDRLAKLNMLYRQNYNDAIGYLRKIVELYPASDAAYIARAAIADMYADKLHYPSQAAVEYQELVSLFGNRSGADVYQEKLAKVYFDMQNYEQCRSAVQSLIAHWPRSKQAPLGMLLVANSYFIQEDYTGALGEYRAILEKYGDMVNRGLIELEIGNCYQSMDQYDPALLHYYAALETHPNPVLVQHQIRHVRDEQRKLKPAAHPSDELGGNAPPENVPPVVTAPADELDNGDLNTNDENNSGL